MKRSLMAVSLLFCLFFSACKASDPENLFEMSGIQTNSAESSQEPMNSTADSTFYPYGNMQKNVPSGNFVRVGDEVLFLQTGENNMGITLYTYNLKTGEISTFCKDATCSHIGDSCAAGGASGNLEIYGGNVYALSSSGAVLKLTGERFEQIINDGVSHFFHSGGKLYVQTTDSSLMVYENEGGKPQMLLEEYAGYWEAVFDGKLYYQFAGVHCVDLNSEKPEEKTLVENADQITDGQFIYYAPTQGLQLYRMDMNGGNQTLLLERPVLPASWNFDEEYFYFRLFTGESLSGEDSQDIYRMKKDNPETMEKIAELPVPVYQIYTVQDFDYLFVTCYSSTGNNDIYLVSKDGSTEPKLLGDFES